MQPGAKMRCQALSWPLTLFTRGRIPCVKIEKLRRDFSPRAIQPAIGEGGFTQSLLPTEFRVPWVHSNADGNSQAKARSGEMVRSVNACHTSMRTWLQPQSPGQTLRMVTRLDSSCWGGGKRRFLGLLAGQSQLFFELQANEGPYLKKQGGWYQD